MVKGTHSSYGQSKIPVSVLPRSHSVLLGKYNRLSATRFTRERHSGGRLLPAGVVVRVLSKKVAA